MQIFESLTAMRLSRPENRTKAPRVRGGLDQVRAPGRAAGPVIARQVLDRQRGVARVGALMPVPIAVAPRLTRGAAPTSSRSRAMSSVERACEGVELLAERHRHRVLQLGAAHLEHVANSTRLGRKRVGQLARAPASSGAVAEDDRELHRGRVGVVGRLRQVDVVVRVQRARSRPCAWPDELERAVGDHLVRVHVRRGAGAALDHVDDELVVVAGRAMIASQARVDRRRPWRAAGGRARGWRAPPPA